MDICDSLGKMLAFGTNCIIFVQSLVHTEFSADSRELQAFLADGKEKRGICVVAVGKPKRVAVRNWKNFHKFLFFFNEVMPADKFLP